VRDDALPKTGGVTKDQGQHPPRNTHAHKHMCIRSRQQHGTRTRNVVDGGGTHTHYSRVDNNPPKQPLLLRPSLGLNLEDVCSRDVRLDVFLV